MVFNVVEWYLFTYTPKIQGQETATAASLPIPPNPYRGLQPFRQQDSRYFFGRDDEIASLHQTVIQQPFMAVLGASGSGKSSLVFAGVLPKLEESNEWQLLHFRPHRNPFARLAECLIPQLYKDPSNAQKRS